MKLKNIIIYYCIFFILFFYILPVYATEQNTLNSNNVETTEENQISDESSEEMKIYSEAAILIEAKTGKILYEKNIYDRKYPASTTKILTAILAIENCDLNETQVASQSAISALKSGYTKANIQVGEEFTIDELISVMMIQSANEAANIIAEHISGSVEEFSNLMNEKAKEIGCLDTHFVNPNGMHSENHYSTAYDMALIARYCMKNEKFREYAALKEASLPRTEYWQDEQVAKNGERIFYNTNNLMQKDSKFYYPTCIGIKSGFTTPAKNCLVSASNKNGFELISVILHAESTDDGQSARYVDTINLFNYGYENYNLSDILEEYDMIEDSEDKNDSEESIGKIVEIENNLLEDSLVEEELTNKLDKNIIKIVIGIICIIIGIFIFCKGKKGKHEEISKLYKFNL